MLKDLQLWCYTLSQRNQILFGTMSTSELDMLRLANTPLRVLDWPLKIKPFTAQQHYVYSGNCETNKYTLKTC